MTEAGHAPQAHTLPELLCAQAERLGEAPFLWHKAQGRYRPRSWRDTVGQVEALSRGLRTLGVRPGDRVALMAENRPEWLVADFAIMAAGAVTVPAYVTASAEDIAHVLRDCGARGVIASRAHGRKLAEALAGAPDVAFVIALGAGDEPDLGRDGPPVHDWERLLEGASSDATPWPEPVTADDLACLFYTSGTDGLPKGVELTHGALLANCAGAADRLAETGLQADETFFSFLPLAHAYEHTAGQCLPVWLGAQIYYAGSLETLVPDLMMARPTVMTVVPRVLETLRQRMLSRQRSGRRWQRWLFERTVAVGHRAAEGAPLGPWDRAVNALAERAVRRRIHNRFGGRIKALVSGGAPLNAEVGRFFRALGLPVLQGYGLTEAGPVVSCHHPGRVDVTTAGAPLAGVEVRTAEDGELLVRSPALMRGYWNDRAATARALRDGWLYTGDVGRVRDDGELEITDRKRHFLKTSGGEMIAPQHVESCLVQEPEIQQAMVYGDGRPYLVALLVPDAAWAEEWARCHNRTPELGRLVFDPEFQAVLEAAVRRANERLAAYERIRRYVLTERGFTTEDGLLTPTLKLRRRYIVAQYGRELDGLYEQRNGGLGGVLPD